MNRLLAAAGVALVVTTTSCGVVKILPPQGAEAEHAPSGPPTAFISSCAVLEKAEVEAALGAPTEEPIMYLGTAGDNRDGNSCIWTSGRSARVSTWVNGSTHAGDGDIESSDAYEELDGIGRSAYMTTSQQNVAEISAHTTHGLGFTVVVGKPGASAAELGTTAVTLAKKIVERLEAAYPGTPDAIVRPAPPAENPCGLLPVTERVAATGWAADRDRDTETPHDLAEPRIGGPGGAGWTCYFYDWAHMRFINIDLSSGPVAPEILAAGAVPVPEPLARPAFYRGPVPISQSTNWAKRQSELSVSLADGRAITLKMADDETDEPTHRRQLIELARIALSHVQGGG